MSGIRLLHAADLHLDAAFGALGGDKAAVLKNETLLLPEKLASLAHSEGVRAALLSGDIFDSPTPSRESAEAVFRALGGMGVPVFISPGNHDHICRRSPYLWDGLPENIHIFKSSVLECVTLEDERLRVWGAAFTDRVCRGMLSGFHADKLPGYTDVLVMHGEVSKDGSSPYNPMSEADIAGSGMDYVALGHIHSFSGLRRSGEAFYAWPGCAAGHGFDETGKKGLVIADAACGECAVKFVPSGSRRYEILSADIGDEYNALQCIMRALPDDAEQHIFRIALTGECSGAPDLPSLYRALEARVFAVSLHDRTVPRRDIWESCGEDTLRGIFLGKMRARFDAAASDEEREAVVMAVRFGLAAMEGRNSPI